MDVGAVTTRGIAFSRVKMNVAGRVHHGPWSEPIEPRVDGGGIRYVQLLVRKSMIGQATRHTRADERLSQRAIRSGDEDAPGRGERLGPRARNGAERLQASFIVDGAAIDQPVGPAPPSRHVIERMGRLASSGQLTHQAGNGGWSWLRPPQVKGAWLIDAFRQRYQI